MNEPKRPIALPSETTAADADVIILDGAEGLRKQTFADLKSQMATAFAGAPETFSPATSALGGVVKVNTSEAPGVTPIVYKKSEVDAEFANIAAARDGATDDLAVITAALAAGSKIRFRSGSHLISANLTIAAGKVLLFEPGAKLKPASGMKITINGEVVAGRYEIFDYSAGGKCVFGVQCTTSEVLPEWYGAKADNTTTNNDTPFARYYDQTLTTSENQQPLSLTMGYYDFSTGFTGRSNMIVRGHPNGKTRLQFSPTAASGTVRLITLPDAADNVHFERVQINARAVTAGVRTTAIGHASSGHTLTNLVLRDVTISAFNQYGLDFYGWQYGEVYSSNFTSVSNITANGGTDDGSAICINVRTFGNAIKIDAVTRTTNCEAFLKSANSGGLTITGECAFEQGAGSPVDGIANKGPFLEILAGSAIYIAGNYFEGIATTTPAALLKLTGVKGWTFSGNQTTGFRTGGATCVSNVLISQNGASYGGLVTGNEFIGLPANYYIFNDGSGGTVAAIGNVYLDNSSTVQTTYSSISGKFSADVMVTMPSEWNYSKPLTTRITTGTTAVVTAMTLEKQRSGGAGSANDGVALQARAMNASGSVQNIGAVRFIYADASNGNEKTTIEFQGIGNGPGTTPLTIFGTGGLLLPVAAINPSAPAANVAALYIDSSGGKVRVVARFPTGAVQVLATEP